MEREINDMHKDKPGEHLRLVRISTGPTDSTVHAFRITFDDDGIPVSNRPVEIAFPDRYDVEAFAKELLAATNKAVLPGSLLIRG